MRSGTSICPMVKKKRSPVCSNLLFLGDEGSGVSWMPRYLTRYAMPGGDPTRTPTSSDAELVSHKPPRVSVGVMQSLSTDEEC